MTHKPKILIVEDEFIIARALKAQIERQGYEIIGMVNNGEDALNIALNEKCDLILMDIMLLGKLKGHDVAREIEKHKSIPIIYLTAYSDENTFSQIRDTKPYSYILKPFKERELFNNIEIALDKHALEKELIEKTILLKELHHRIKNNMASIAGFLNLHSKKIKDPNDTLVFKQCIAQISSLCTIHQILYESDNLKELNIKEYITKLMQNLSELFISYNKKIKTSLELDSFKVTIEKAIPCGLLINEIIINSLKHAFPKKNEGHIRIVVSLKSNQMVHLTISDNGIGILAQHDNQSAKTLGSQLIQLIVENQLQGSVNISSKNGTEYQITFSL